MARRVKFVPPAKSGKAQVLVRVAIVSIFGGENGEFRTYQ